MNHRTVLSGITVLLSVYCGGPVSAQPRQFELHVSGYRPLALAAEQLEQRYGIPITYEDPEYTHGTDLLDATDAKWRAVHPNDRSRSLLPRPGQLSFSIPESPDGQTRPLDIETSIRDLLTYFNGTGLPGNFRMGKTGGMIHLIPSLVRDSSGALRETRSPFDRLISMPSQSRSGLDTIEAIVTAINAVPGRSVGIGTIPLNYLGQSTVTIGAAQEPARVVIAKALQGMGWRDKLSTPLQKTSWQLFYAPDGHTYFLNIHGVPAEHAPDRSRVYSPK